MDKMKIHLIQMKIDELLAVCDEHNNDPGELINILHAAQGIFGYLPREVQEIIAAGYRCKRADVAAGGKNAAKSEYTAKYLAGA